MAVAIWARVIGVDTLTVKLSKVQRTMITRIRHRVDRAGAVILKTATELAPPPITVPRVTKRNPTGRLKGSLQKETSEDGMRVQVGTRDVHYAKFVELGTGIRGASAAGQLIYKPPGYKHGGKPGMLPQPFIYNIWLREGKKFIRDCGTIAGETIKEVMG